MDDKVKKNLSMRNEGGQPVYEASLISPFSSQVW